MHGMKNLQTQDAWYRILAYSYHNEPAITDALTRQTEKFWMPIMRLQVLQQHASHSLQWYTNPLINSLTGK